MAATPNFPVTVPQGTDFVQEFTAEDENGVGIDLTNFDSRDAEFRQTQSPTGTLEATGTVNLVDAINGVFEVVIGHDDTHAMTTDGFYTVHLEDTSTPNSRFAPVRGPYTFEKSTIATP